MKDPYGHFLIKIFNACLRLPVYLVKRYLIDLFLIDIVSNYTLEAGVRELERKFGAICRAVAVQVAEKEKQSTSSTESNCVSTLSQIKKYPFAILWSKPMGIPDSISWTEHATKLLTSLVQIEKD